MIKNFTKKSLALILCVTVLLSCMVFAMPSANAAASDYKYRVYVQTPDQYEMTHDAKEIKVYYKANNGTSSSTTTSTTFSVTKDQFNDDYAEWYFPSESGATISGFPWKVGFGELKSNNNVWNAHIHVELQVSSDGTTWHWVAGNTAGDSSDYQNMSRKSNMSDITVDAANYPKATTAVSLATNPAANSSGNPIKLDGVNNKTVTLTATCNDQYGVQMVASAVASNAVTYSLSSPPYYNPSAFSVSGNKLTITKDAHVDEESTNMQSVTVKAQCGESAVTAKVYVEDEKYTAVYKWYESNETNPASPTVQTYEIPNIYYGDYPQEEQIPEVIDNYYTDTQHFTDGEFPSVAIDNTFTMIYTAASHNMLTKVEQEATCQGAGTTKHYCNCGYYYIETGTPAQVDHDYVKQVIDPTCTEDGYTINTCRFCGDTFNSDTVEALGHSYRQIGTTAATCTQAGSKTYECTRCHDIKTEEIPAKGHSYNSKVIAPTCTEGGYTYWVCKNRCGSTYTTDETEPLGHDHQIIEDIPATCTTAGRKVYKCSRCDDGYTDTIDALGHDFETLPSQVTTPATCTEDGVRTYYCSRCDAVETETIKSTGHNYEKTTVAPDCEHQGYDLYKCSNCQDEYIDTESFTDALGHLWDDGEITTAATCTENGVMTYTCSRCQGTKEETIVSPGHNYQSTVINPTCTEDGYTLFVCQRCTDSYTDNTVEKLGHNFSTNKVTKEPTCEEDGVRTYYCSRCDATDEEPIAKLNHNYVPNVVAPTCTEQGYTEYTCSNCQDTYKDNYQPSLGGHLFTDYFYNEDATCTENGTETAICDRCDATDTRVVEDSALGHSFVTYTYNEDATCTENGTETAKCERCDVTDTRTKEDSALGHSFINYVYNDDATCTGNGTETAKCERCDVTDTRTKEDSALGHSFINYVYNDDATCTENGTETAKCERCDVTDTRTKENSALGHSFINYVYNDDATCTENGTETAKCERCDVTDTRTKEHSALGHAWSQIVEDPENEANGYVYYKCDTCGKYANAVVVDNTPQVGDEEFESVDAVKADTLEISAPAFNKYYNEEQQYDYSTRGAALRYTDPTYIDDYTTQDTRFTASLFIPSNIDVTFGGASENKLTDFGFVFAQTGYIDDASELTLGSSDAYSISVPQRNAGAGDISNWSGVTVHNDTFGGSTLTFNLLLKIKAINWTKAYCARAYVTYTQNGFTYTVYDSAFASRSVEDIARAVVASESESQEAKDYCQNKILNNLNAY